jgi:hypothetical protein
MLGSSRLALPAPLSLGIRAAFVAVVSSGCASPHEGPPAAETAVARSETASTRWNVHPAGETALWVQTQTLTAGQGPGGYLGTPVALSGATAVVGAPGFGATGGAYVYAFDPSTSRWIEEALLTSSTAPDAGNTGFGDSVAAEGETIVVGSWGVPDQAAYVFRQNGATVSFVARLSEPDAGDDTQFGASVAVSGDTVVVGAPNVNAVFVYTQADGGWPRVAELTPAAFGGAGGAFGTSVAISADTAVVADPGDGVAEVFVRDGGAWSPQATLGLGIYPGAFDGVYEPVAVLGDTAIVGIPSATVGPYAARGVVEVFQRSGATWSAGATPYVGAGTTFEEGFGFSVALAPGSLVVGAPRDTLTNQIEGSVYVYTPADGGWTLDQQLNANDHTAGGEFGSSVAAAPGTMLVGTIAGFAPAYVEGYGPANGSPCASGAACGSGYCVSGVCCDSTCTGGCAACTTQGTCAPLAAGQEGPTCAPYRCAGTLSCPTGCSSDQACVQGTYCSDGRCVPQSDGADACDASDQCASGSCTNGVCLGTASEGASCGTGGDCASTFCIDGVCCNAPCDGQCEACNLPDAGGICSPLSSGPPHGNRAPCAGGGGPCGGSCNGATNVAACTYPTTSCGSSCENGTDTVRTCDGLGACGAGVPHPCKNLRCADDSICLAACATDLDCLSGFRCVTGACEPEGTVCIDAGTSRADIDGGITECAPFVCDFGSGTCLHSCVTARDCIAPDVCDPTSAQCVPPVASRPISAGCSCTTTGACSREAGRNAWTVLFAIAATGAIGAARRRRRS